MTVEQEIIQSHQFENGLVLIGQSMPWLESAAFSFQVPAGCRYDPVDQIGVANFVCEMVQRGAGEMDSRQYIERLEQLGVDYSSSASVYGTHYSGASCSAQLHDALTVFADVLRRPHFPAEQMEDGRQVCYQEIAAIADDLPQRTLIELRNRYYGQTDGRDCHGSATSVASIQLDDLQNFYQQNYRPNGMILGVAGKIDWPLLKDHVASLFADWHARPEVIPEASPAEHGTCHLPFDSQQTHIAIAYPGVCYSDPDYYRQAGSVSVLSGGMSSRLFTEVREKRGLCYSVFASNHSVLDRGCVVCYCGTSAERAQESLDVILQQLVNLKLGITADELRRLKVQVRSDLIMQQESCRARAGSLTGDWFHFGRVRTLDECNSRISSLTVEEINRFLQEHPPRQFDLVTLGPHPLEINNDGISSTPTG
ncbi:MAG: insulinase family protein [Mariniblastus sp.]|nr:insulinase family protein [Mariniblastus sp.]